MTKESTMAIVSKGWNDRDDQRLLDELVQLLSDGNADRSLVKSCIDHLVEITGKIDGRKTTKRLCVYLAKRLKMDE